MLEFLAKDFSFLSTFMVVIYVVMGIALATQYRVSKPGVRLLFALVYPWLWVLLVNGKAVETVGGVVIGTALIAFVVVAMVGVAGGMIVGFQEGHMDLVVVCFACLGWFAILFGWVQKQ